MSRAGILQVAVDARPLLAVRTGVETYLGQLLTHLRADERISLRLLSDLPCPFPVESPRCRAVLLPGHSRLPRALGDTWIVRDVARHLAAEPADVFFTSSAKFPPGSIPTVVTVHDLGWRQLPAAYTRSERARQWLWTGWAAQRATRLIAPSEFTRSELTRWIPSCAPRVRVIHEAAAPGWQRVQDARALAAARQRLGFDGPFALAVGTLSPKKQLEPLFEAFASLRERGFPEHRLVVVGRVGWKAEPILRAARSHPQIQLVGYVDDATLLSLYALASLYVTTSPCEGFGLPALEALACGTPVVAVNAGAVPEVVGDAALLCADDVAALGAALARALGDPELRAELVARGTQRARGFSGSRAARELAAVLQEAARTAA
jgi:glycosyltransferase involved in cell wall biosynthesis